MAGMPVRLRRGEMGACAVWVRDAVRGMSRVRFSDEDERAAGDLGASDAQGFILTPRRVG